MCVVWERFKLKTFSTHMIRVAYGIGIKYGDEVTLASHVGCENDLVIAGIDFSVSQASLDPDLRIHVNDGIEPSLTFI